MPRPSHSGDASQGQKTRTPAAPCDPQQLWIQHDGTERGIAEDLVAAGVPKERIVLGFRPPQGRRYTDFAAA